MVSITALFHTIITLADYPKYLDPVYLKRLSELAEANINASRFQNEDLSKARCYQVKSIYYNLLYRTEQRKLNQELITLYERILRAAEVRFKKQAKRISWKRIMLIG